MSSKKSRYSSSISTAWLVPHVASRAPSMETIGGQTAVNTPERQSENQHRTAPSSVSTSRSKYTSRFPATWTAPSTASEQSFGSEDGFRTPSRQSKNTNNHKTTGSSSLKPKPFAAAAHQPGESFSPTRHTGPSAPVEDLFLQHRSQSHFSRDSRMGVQRDHRRVAPHTVAPPPPPQPAKSRLWTPNSVASTSSAAGSCDLPVIAPTISPSYSVI